MPFFTILFGLALMAVGVGTYMGAGAEASTSAFVMQMILGALAIALGVGAMLKKQMRMHLMHAAVLLAAMGVIVPAVLFLMYLFKLDRNEQMNLLRALLTVAFSGAYVYLAVKSFRTARTARKAGKTDTTEKTDKPAKTDAPEPPSPPETEPDSAPAE